MPPTEDVMEAWNRWFASIGDMLVDSGNPFGSGREITRSGTQELPTDSQAVTGYLITDAEAMNEAEKNAKDSPIVTGIRVYEALSM